MTSDVSVQPDNRSGLQSALEQVLDEWLGDIETTAPHTTLLFPRETPTQFLPALAIERGVMDWAPDDSETMVRNTVTDGLLIQSRSCTRAGLRESIEALGYDVTVTRQAPYAIHVTAALLEEPMDEHTSRRIRERINTYKAERDSVTLQLIRNSRATLYTGAAMYSGQHIHIRYYAPDVISVTADSAAGAATWSFQTVSIQMEE